MIEKNIVGSIGCPFKCGMLSSKQIKVLVLVLVYSNH